MTVELASAILCALTTVVCALYVRFSGPVVASHALRDLLEDNESLRADWTRTKVGLEGIAEEISNDVTKATRIRNQITARQSKERSAEPADPMAEARARFRAQGVL